MTNILIFKNLIKLTLATLVTLTLGLASFSGSANQINLNTADIQTLQELPGIGAKKAAAIVDLRQKLGGFESFQQLLQVKGIGSIILLKIKSSATIDNASDQLSEASQPKQNQLVNIDATLLQN